MIEQNLSHPSAFHGLSREIADFIETGRGSFEALILRLHLVQRADCPPYAAFCAGQAAPASWREIPALPLSAFRHAAIRCFPEGETFCTFRTSGTTGEGFGEHHFQTLEVYRAAALAGWRGAGLPEGNVYCLVPAPEDAPYSSLSRMAGWLASRPQFFPGDWNGLAQALRQAKKPPTLFGTALAFLDFFEWLNGRVIELPPGSLAVETGGYKGSRRTIPKEEFYALFGAKLGLGADRVFNEYGMTELSSQFYASGLGGPHRSGPWVRALVIDPETGREAADGAVGPLRIFDLANVGSCCVVQTRDLAVRRGSGFALIGRDPAALPRGCSRAADEMLSR